MPIAMLCTEKQQLAGSARELTLSAMIAGTIRIAGWWLRAAANWRASLA